MKSETMPYAIHGSKEGYFEFTISDTGDAAIEKLNEAATHKRVLIHPLSTLEVRFVKVLERRSPEDQIAAVMLRGEKAGLFERGHGKTTVKYQQPKQPGPACIDCGRSRSASAGQRCRECYSARAAKNALWKLKSRTV